MVFLTSFLLVKSKFIVRNYDALSESRDVKNGPKRNIDVEYMHLQNSVE